MSQSKKRKCLQCGKEIGSESQFFPFCCERCKLIDLGKWANEEYRVAADDASPEQDSTSRDLMEGPAPSGPHSRER